MTGPDDGSAATGPDDGSAATGPDDRSPATEPDDRSEITDPDDRRVPHSVFGQGREPDPRFSLANERTALAWIRTAIALMAAGVGLVSLVRIADLPRVVVAAAVVLCLAGGMSAGASALGWRRRELAIRTGSPLPGTPALLWLAGALVLLGVFLAVVLARTPV
jgi:putative membrane protein